MERIRERLEGLETLLAEHPLPESLRRMAGELEALAAYAGLATGVEPAVRAELAWTAALLRDTWTLLTADRTSGEASDAAKASRMWHLCGALLDRAQDLLAVKPAHVSDYFLDALSVIVPFVGSGATVKGAVAIHRGAIAGAQIRLEEVLWHHFLSGSEKSDPEAAWAKIEEKRAAVKRCSDLIFVDTAEPRTQAATLVLLYLSVAVSRLNKLKETGA